jgi:hypothetical protein
VGETLEDRAKGEIADDAGEVAEPPGHRLEEGERHGRVAAADAEQFRPRHGEHAGGFERDGGGDVSSPVE